jgi:hypothetical protein
LYLALPDGALEVPPIPDFAGMVFEKESIYLCLLDPKGGFRQKENPAGLYPSTFLLGVLHVVP